MSGYLRKIDGKTSWFVFVKNSSVSCFEGVQIFLHQDYAQVSNLFARVDDNYVPCTEQEFTRAFEEALSRISRLVPVAA